MRRLPFMLVVGIVAVAASVRAEPPDWLTDRADRLFLRLHIRPGDCPAGLEAVGAADDAFCGAYEKGWKRLKQTLKAYDVNPNRNIVEEYQTESGQGVRRGSLYFFSGDWRREGELRVRDWLEDSDLVVIAYDEAAARVAVLPKYSCLPADVQAREDLYYPDARLLLAPNRIEGAMPPIPGRSPTGLRPSGDVVVQFVVTREGAVRDACVLFARPRGFGKAALKAIRRWRYEPATVNDRAVDAVVSLDFVWRQERWHYERTSRPVH